MNQFSLEHQRPSNLPIGRFFYARYIKKRCAQPALACATFHPVTPVKRDRDWRPGTLPRRKPWSLLPSLRLFHSRLFMVARVGSRKARRFPLGVSGTPTCPSHRPQLALGAVVLANHTPGGRHGYHFPCARRCAIPCAPHYGQQLPRPHPVLNCLSRCKAMLTANEPMYGFALQDLAPHSRLLQRCNPLICRWGWGKPCKPPKKNMLPPWQHRPSHVQNLPPAYYAHWAQCRPAQSADQPQSTPFGQ